ncbi:fimbrial protein StdA [Salmonella enterica subsp. enterica serovar Infantis]|nr:fimbrial protein StdA [Salmonella enterica subsp. enterica serovar Infantis]
MFKQTTLAVLAASAMMCGSTAFAADPSGGPFGGGTIHFTGTISNTPCSVAPGDLNMTVPFGTVSYRLLKTAGASTPSVPITIHLTDCSFDPDSGATPSPVGLFSKVAVAFNGPGDVTNKVFTNTGSATNVGIQILQSDNTTLIVPNAPADSTGHAQQLQFGDNQLNFFARLTSLTGSATPGSVEGTVTYVVTYS